MLFWSVGLGAGEGNALAPSLRNGIDTDKDSFAYLKIKFSTIKKEQKGRKNR